MREIEFRAKAINRERGREYRTKYKNGDWVYGLLTRHKDPEFPKICAEMTNTDGVSGIDVDEDTLCQYTGLTDKNGKKIFEGDIIYLEEEKMYGKVCFERGQWYVYWYGLIYKEGIGDVFDIVNENPLQDELLTDEGKIWLEIVGNVLDNPKLLQGGRYEN